MHPLVYLDQNILSDLRARKLAEINDDHLSLLKRVILASHIQIIYSDVTLAEINQISIDSYKAEHIDLLEELSARYLPAMGRISQELAHKVWSNYLQNELDNISSGIASVTLANEQSLRKLSGLKIQDSFLDLRNTLQTELLALLDGAVDKLDSLDVRNLDANERDVVLKLKNWIPDLLAKSQDLPILPISEEQKFGPKAFREYDKLQALNVMKMPSDIIVKSIEKIFLTEHSEFKFEQYFDGVPGKIAMAYSLMNWAGYHADDFDKVTEKRDRFRASSNDLQHAIKASVCNFLISSDHAFRMKAIASYHYAEVRTIVCSPKEFLLEYCQFKN